MAPYGGLQQIFEKPPPENPSLLESLSCWKPIRSVKSVEQSYTELFGELHFRENPETSLPSALVSEAAASWSSGSTYMEKKDEFSPFSCYSGKSSDKYYSLKNSESLQLCTEGLGFESLDAVEDMNNEIANSSVLSSEKEKALVGEDSTTYMGSNQYKIAKSCGSSCPPPISCIGRTGNTWTSFKSHRQDGRFVLEEVTTPTHDYLHASRQDGRLKLSLVQPHDDDDDDDDAFLSQEEGEDENGQENDDHHDPDHCVEDQTD